MAVKIRISGEIGYEVQSADILKMLDEAAGADLEIEIASPGGSAYTGIEIANGLRAYKKDHPTAQIMVTITGLAASMASYIAAVDAADMVVAYDNAVGMYHNPWVFSMGDSREMRKTASMLDGVTGILAKMYVKRTGKPDAEIREMMDAETWLFGDELKAAGFVDEIVSAGVDGEPADRIAALTTAKLAFSQMKEHAKDHAESAEKIAAMVRDMAPTGSTPPAPPAKPKQDTNTRVAGSQIKPPAKGAGKGRKFMDLNELKIDSPETYAEAVEAGVKKEQERVTALMAMRAEKAYEGMSAVQETIDESIAKGRSKDETLALVLATFSKSTAKAEQDNPGDIVSGSVNSATGEPVGKTVELGFVGED